MRVIPPSKNRLDVDEKWRPQGWCGAQGSREQRGEEKREEAQIRAEHFASQR